MIKNLKFKIIIVDDDEDLNALISKELKNTDYIADFYLDATSANKALNENDYLGAVLDINLKTTSSAGLFFSLKEDETSRNFGIPVIVMSAHFNDSILLKLKGKADATLKKTMSKGQLKSALDQLKDQMNSIQEKKLETTQSIDILNSNHTREALKNQFLKIINGDDVDLKNEYGQSTLMLASIQGELEIVKQLIKLNATTSEADQTKRSSLHYAVLSNKPSIVKLILERQIHFSSCDDFGVSPFEIALLNNNLEVCELLINHGANVNEKLSNGESSLLCATKLGQLKLVQLLFQYGFDSLLFQGKEQSVIDHATKYNQNDLLEFFKMLNLKH